jgi:hypothetical protein
MVVAASDVGIMPMANVFRQATGRCNVTYNDESDVTVGVFKLGVS